MNHKLMVMVSEHLLMTLPKTKELIARWDQAPDGSCTVHLDLREKVVTAKEQCIVNLVFEATPYSVKEAESGGTGVLS